MIPFASRQTDTGKLNFYTEFSQLVSRDFLERCDISECNKKLIKATMHRY